MTKFFFETVFLFIADLVHRKVNVDAQPTQANFMLNVLIQILRI